MKVKICGITNREDAEAAVAAGADALGFILYEPSKRYVPMEVALKIIGDLPPFVQTVAVTVDATKEFSNLGWRKQLKQFGVAQLHGHESPVHVRAVSKYLPVIKVFPAELDAIGEASRLPDHMIETVNKLKDARNRLVGDLKREPTVEEVAEGIGQPFERVRAIFRIADLPEFPEHKTQNQDLVRKLAGSKSTGTQASLNEYESHVSAFMLDTPSKNHGGTGQTFDWNLALAFKARIKKPLILSGGLNPENVAKAIETVQPYAVDVSSGVEISPGKKDHAKLRDFIQICKRT